MGFIETASGRNSTDDSSLRQHMHAGHALPLTVSRPGFSDKRIPLVFFIRSHPGTPGPAQSDWLL
jgi:hypothetical protein